MRYNSSWLISLTPLELADQPYAISGRLTGLKMAVAVVFGVYASRQNWSDTEPVCAGKPVSGFLFILHAKNVRRNIIGQLRRKNNTLHHYPTPYPPERVYRLVQFSYNLTTGSTQIV